MSIYMDKPPTTCECCPCNDDSYRCGATGEIFDSPWYMGRLASCPIKPLADVVEVVRCKDCKHYKRDIPCVGGHYNGCDEWLDEGSQIAVYDNDFCSYGERADA